MKLLLVDDSKLQRSVLQRDLSVAGFKVFVAADGEQGLRLAHQELPNLILLDMMLPKISGLDLLRRLKDTTETKHIPVVVLTGLSKGNEGKLIVDGAAAFCEKSEALFQNNSAALIQTVQRVLGQQTAMSGASA
jgi:DNA-binding response OmpR family regulator